MGYLGRVRAVIQRVTRAEVRVGEEVVGRIGAGLVALVGVKTDDTPTAARYIAEMKAKGKTVTPAQMGPAPTSSGGAVSSKPEKQMAHSPTQTKR